MTEGADAKVDVFRGQRRGGLNTGMPDGDWQLDSGEMS